MARERGGRQRERDREGGERERERGRGVVLRFEGVMRAGKRNE